MTNAYQELIDNLQEDDLVIITADHMSNDPIAEGTDHTREYIPVTYDPKK